MTQKEQQVTVRLFKRLHPKRLRIEGAMRVKMKEGRERTMSSVLIETAGAGIAVDGERAGQVQITPLEGSVRLVPQRAHEREVPGTLTITRHNKELMVVLQLSLSDYVAGVVMAEMPGGHKEAQKAQAIVARTYALVQRKRHGEQDYCDLTHCQVYRGAPPEKISELVQATKGQILTEGLAGEARSERSAQPAAVFYSSTCGGHTASARVIWGKTQPETLVGVPDEDDKGRPWCAKSSHATWQFEVAKETLAEKLKGLGPLERPISIRTKARRSGWVQRVYLSGLSDSISGEAFRVRMGRIFGWSKFKSARFTVVDKEDVIRFEGRGLGHGVGLCQFGAMAMAEAGHPAEKILAHYFPNYHVAVMD